jgi:hypothetical protein
MSNLAKTISTEQYSNSKPSLAKFQAVAQIKLAEVLRDRLAPVPRSAPLCVRVALLVEHSRRLALSAQAACTALLHTRSCV